jgi:aminoglycoside phosphotransferase (APT) family kinase protein
MTVRPSHDALWASVEQTLRDVVLPTVADDFARQATVHLIGLAHYARTRPTLPLSHGDASANLDAALAETAVLQEAFRGRVPESAAPSSAGTVDPQALSQYLSAKFGRPTQLSDSSRLSVGHSRAMFRVRTHQGDDLVVRVEQGGVFGSSSGDEFAAMHALYLAGFPIASVRWFEPGTDLFGGQPFFVMDFVPGDATVDERLVGAVVATDFVRRLHALHQLDPYQVGLAVPSAADATHLQIDKWAGIYRAASPEPVELLEQAAAWLHQHAPVPERVCVVHGDAGPGNFVHKDGQIVAVTDWEFVHAGDPAEDWSFCLSMRGSRTLPRSEWLNLFRQHADVDLSDAHWAYWETFNLFKGACANLTCLAVFESGANRAPNMAIIGTNLHAVFLRRLTDVIANDSRGTT